jgi:chitinase
MRVHAVFLFVLTLSLTAAQPKPAFKVVGYYSMKLAMENPKDVPFKWLTHINLWFLNPDSLGNFKDDFSMLKPFIQSARNKNVRILLSIGGGSKQPQYKRLLKDENRTEFIRKLVEVVQTSNVDGLDVDLEGSDIDENYENFIVELASALRPRGKLITAAVAVYYKEKMTDKALAQFDFVNIMSYDRTGPWRPDRPGPHSTFTHAVQDLIYFGNERKNAQRKNDVGRSLLWLWLWRRTHIQSHQHAILQYCVNI